MLARKGCRLVVTESSFRFPLRAESMSDASGLRAPRPCFLLLVQSSVGIVSFTDNLVSGGF